MPYHYITVSIVMRDCESATHAKVRCEELLPCDPDENTKYMESWEIVEIRAADTARILAAAPEMLAALKRMREVFEQLSDGDWRSLDATYVDQLIASDGLRGCDKVIAKAEGRDE